MIFDPIRLTVTREPAPPDFRAGRWTCSDGVVTDETFCDQVPDAVRPLLARRPIDVRRMPEDDLFAPDEVVLYPHESTFGTWYVMSVGQVDPANLTFDSYIVEHSREALTRYLQITKVFAGCAGHVRTSGPLCDRFVAVVRQHGWSLRAVWDIF